MLEVLDTKLIWDVKVFLLVNIALQNFSFVYQVEVFLEPTNNNLSSTATFTQKLETAVFIFTYIFIHYVPTKISKFILSCFRKIEKYSNFPLRFFSN